MPARLVIHAVGPVYSARAADADLLSAVYGNALRVAVEHDVHSVAFPSISTGAYRYPLYEAAPIAVRSISDFLQREQHTLELVRFVLFDSKTMAAYGRALHAP